VQVDNTSRLGIRSDVKSWQETLREPCLSVLLGIQIVFIFVIAPLASDGLLGHAVVDGCQSLLALVSIFVVPGVGMTRGIILLGFILTLVTAPAPASDPSRLLHFAGLFLFTMAVTIGVVKAVFSAGEVTHHRVQGAVVAYLNLSLIFTPLYAAITLMLPGSFSHVSAENVHQFGQLLYFSLSTLTTTGYGDIVPLHAAARSLSNLESVCGQLFLATLLARLVNLQLVQGHRQASPGAEDLSHHPGPD
jgi:hypothetical protein